MHEVSNSTLLALSLALWGCSPGPIVMGAGSGESDESGVHAEDTTTGSEPADACSIAAQDCPALEKCVWTPNVGPHCVPTLGAGAAEMPCAIDPETAIDDCGPNSACWDAVGVDGFGEGVCVEFCRQVDCGEAAGPCVAGDDTRAQLCLPTGCDVFEQDCEDGFEGCMWTGSGFVCIYNQAPPTSWECVNLSDCYAGGTCLDGALLPYCEFDKCCAQHCDLDEPSCDEGELECVAYFDEGTAPAGYERLGVCVGM